LSIQFLWGEQVVKCDTSDKESPVILATDVGRDVTVDGVLVAAGRTSNTSDLNLEAAGIAPGRKGLISVDKVYRTTVPHIYAAGDVIGFPALAATSMEQARIAMCNAFNASLQCDLAPLLPTGIYTIPEVSMVGEA